MTPRLSEEAPPRRFFPCLCSTVLLFVLLIQGLFLLGGGSLKIPDILGKRILEANLLQGFKVESGQLRLSFPHQLFLEDCKIQDGNNRGLSIFLEEATLRLGFGTWNLSLKQVRIWTKATSSSPVMLESARLEKREGKWIVREARVLTVRSHCFLKTHPDFSGATLGEIVAPLGRFFKQFVPREAGLAPQRPGNKFSPRRSLGKNIRDSLAKVHKWESSFQSSERVQLAFYLEREGLSVDFWARDVGLKNTRLKQALGHLRLSWEEAGAPSFSAYVGEVARRASVVGKHWSLSMEMDGHNSTPYLRLHVEDCQLNSRTLGKLTADMDFKSWREAGTARGHFLLFKEGLVFSGEGLLDLGEKTFSTWTSYSLDVPQAFGGAFSLEESLKFPFSIKGSSTGHFYLRLKEDLAVEAGELRLTSRDVIFDRSQIDVLRLRSSINEDIFTIHHLQLRGKQLHVDFSGFQNLKEDFGRFSLEGRLRPNEYSSFFDEDLKEFMGRFSFPNKPVEVGLFLKTKGHSLKTYTYQNIYASLKGEDLILENLPVKSLSLDVWANRQWLTIRNLEGLIENRRLSGDIYMSLDRQHDTKQLIVDLDSSLSIRDVLLIIEEQKVPSFVADMDAPIYLNCLALMEVDRKTGRKDLYLRSRVDTPTPIWAGDFKADYFKADIYQTPQALVFEKLKIGLGGGHLEGTISLFPKQKEDFKGNLSFSGIDLAKLAEDSIKKSSFPIKQGTLEGSLKLLGHHRNKESFTGNLSVKLKGLELFRFAILGNISEALGIGLIDFKEFRGDFVVRQGDLIIQSARLKTPVSELKVLGYYDFVKDYLDLILETRPFRRVPLIGGIISGLLTPVAAALRMAVRGPLKNPEHRVVPFVVTPSPSSRPK